MSDKPRILHRLNVCRAWQWRSRVLTLEAKNLIEGVGDILVHLATGVVGLLMIPLALLAILWRFTGGVLWHAMTVPDSTINQLAAALPRRKESESLSTTTRAARTTSTQRK